MGKQYSKQRNIDHCILRAKERFDIIFNKQDIIEISHKVRKRGDGVKLVHRKSLRCLIFRVSHKGQLFHVYYSKTDRMIRTILNWKPD